MKRGVWRRAALAAGVVRRLPLGLALFALVVLGGGSFALNGCGRGSPSQSRSEGTRADSSFAEVTSAKGRTSLEISRASGRQVYDHYCAICHGESGAGDGFNAYNLKATFGVTPTSFADSLTVATLPDSVAMLAIRAGGPAVGKSPAMPAWGLTLTPSEVADVWNYSRSFAASAHR